jgi:hypothetical protein
MNGNKKTQKVYRLALYGLSGSGKTSVLAALAMPRYPHPLGHTCIWRTIDVSSHKDEVISQNKHLMTLYRSQEWMEKAIQKLSQGQLPQSNPATDNHFIFEYDFTAATHQTFRVELIDYSGDLINPETSQNILAKHLRQTFVEMDGIIVLAEAPFQTDKLESGLNQRQQAYTDLYPLRQAFSLLRCERPDCVALEVPVALLITKWDRYSEIDYTNPAREQSKLDALLKSNPPPPQKGLRDVLHYSVTGGNFNIFPVSALGESESVPADGGKVLERPKQVSPLKAFGLEDAFIWIVQQRNAIDLQNYQEQAPFSFKSCKKTGLELLRRFPKGSEQAKQVQTLLQNCQKNHIVHILYLVLAAIFLWFGTETTIDVVQYRQYNAIINNNPQATLEQIEPAQQWLKDYLAAPYFRHVISKRFFNESTVQAHLTQLQAQQEQLLWQPVEQYIKINDLLRAHTQTQAYLKYYPYGQHAQEAQEILLRADIEQKMQAGNFLAVAQLFRQHADNQHLLKINRTEFKTRVIQEIEQKMQQALNSEGKLTGAIELVNEYARLPSELQTQAGQRQIIATFNRLVIQEIEQQVKQKLHTKGSLKGVINLVKEYAQLPFELKIEAGQREIKNIFNKLVINKVEQQMKKVNLDAATHLLDEYATLPYELQSQQGRRQIAFLQRHIDQTLYETVSQLKTEEAIKNYLQKAPLQTMEKEVSSYKVYLDQQNSIKFKELKLKLTQIYWGKQVEEDDDNVVQVFWNKKLVIVLKKVESKHNHRITFVNFEQTNDLVPVTNSYDEIEVQITIVNEGLFFDTVYEGIREDTLANLAKGFSIELRNTDDNNEKTGTLANFEIKGYPKEPYLPPWHEER